MKEIKFLEIEKSDSDYKDKLEQKDKKIILAFSDYQNSNAKKKSIVW